MIFSKPGSVHEEYYSLGDKLLRVFAFQSYKLLQRKTVK